MQVPFMSARRWADSSGLSAPSRAVEPSRRMVGRVLQCSTLPLWLAGGGAGRVHRGWHLQAHTLEQVRHRLQRISPSLGVCQMAPSVLSSVVYFGKYL